MNEIMMYLINYDWTTHFLYGLYYLVYAIVVIIGWEVAIRKDLVNYLIGLKCNSDETE